MSLTTFKILGVESYSLPRLNQEEIENINSTEIETMIKDLLINKSPGPDSLTGKFYQTFREELTPVLLKLFQKVADEGKFPNSFYEATFTMIPKPDKDTIKKKKWKSQATINDGHRCKNPKQNTSNPYPAIH